MEILRGTLAFGVLRNTRGALLTCPRHVGRNRFAYGMTCDGWWHGIGVLQDWLKLTALEVSPLQREN